MLEHSGVTLFFAGTAGFVVTLILIQTLCAVAPRVGLIDIPDSRKRHAGNVPLVGGIALSVAYLLVTSLMLPVSQAFIGFASCIGILLCVGLLDDSNGIRPTTRLIAEVGVSALVISLGDLQITSLGNLFGTGEIMLAPPVGVLFTVFCVVSLINGLNMLDGLDGLAGGVAGIMLAAFMVISLATGVVAAGVHVGVFLACLGGFLLFHNLRSPMRRRLVFLGDAGSMVLGFALAWMAIDLSERPGSTVYPMAMVWILGLVVLDTVATVLRRLMQGRSPLSAGRDHLHHLLQELGCTQQQTVGILLAAAATLAGIGIAAWQFQVPEVYLTWGFTGMGLAYFAAVTIGWHRTRRGSADVVPFAPVALAVDPPLEAADIVMPERKYG